MPIGILEIALYAFIAFLIINRLLSILGTEDKNDNEQKNSFFGENSTIRDVSDLAVDIIPKKKFSDRLDYPLSDILYDSANREIIDSFSDIELKLGKFDPKKFLKNSAKAFQIIIESLKNNDKKMLEQLVDRRYIDKLIDKKDQYISLELVHNEIESKFYEVTFFGNSVIIRVIFKSKEFLPEEWSFYKNSNDDSSNWYLSNIEKLEE